MDIDKIRKRINGKRRESPTSLWLFINEGVAHPIGLAPLKDYHEFFHPLLETGFTYPISMLWKVTGYSIERSQEIIQNYYQDLINAKLYYPGIHGDWIKCSLFEIGDERYLNLDILGHAAWGDKAQSRAEPDDEFTLDEKVGTRALWLQITNGKMNPIGLAPLRNYKKTITPILETKFTYPISMSWKITNQTKAKTEELLLSYYNDLVNAKVYYPGRYGDWIKCTQLVVGPEKTKYLNLDIIGAAAWVKPTLASDLGIFIKSQERFYFVCIIRGNSPGQGKPAIIGGIMNADKVLDSGIYTMLKESREEGNLIISYDGTVEDLREDYMITDIPVIVKGFECIDPSLTDIRSIIYYSTTIPTTEQERNPDGLKRVYQTSAYALLIDTKEVIISETDLARVFTAGDDATAMVYYDVTTYFKDEKEENIPNFGLEHHPTLFQAMVRTLKKKRMD
ncbi:hypothetical protein [Candidatus Lokiarchaeum ossiferum]|uniref:hypothetical protein n=1 Tax=Candidatus Lokiarchaeum ossiferum TaxID=2951803 RepID=UPI00352DBEDD